MSKEYRVHRRAPGTRATLRSIFRRQYETVQAVSGLSFRVAAGERIGFLGPNGAGKTTTLKVLAGLLHPTSGSVRVVGHEPRRRERAFLERITLVMGQKQQLLWDLPPADTFALNRAVYDVPQARFDETMAELTELLALESIMYKPTRQLSLGERMRCELATALLHRPQVLFLDEPTIGLDVTMQATMREFIRSYNERHGATVLLTSHYMADVAALCPRVIVIGQGRLLHDGALDALVRRLAPEKLVDLKLLRPVDAADLARFGTVVEHGDARVVLRVAQAELRDAVAGVLAALPVADLTVTDPPLEDVMQRLFSSAP
ncbi:MAG: ATP-binding cassette domain-containing protein [Myxococcales bacterium]|nr:ATP-binding cassette domain-containing protein [Myxococcales bacterium]